MVAPRSLALLRAGNGLPSGLLWVAFLLLLAGALRAPLSADTVFLKNGSRLENVVTLPGEDGTLVVFRNGQVQRYRTGEVFRVAIGPVTWPPALSRAEIDRIVQEKVAEYRKQENRTPVSSVEKGMQEPSSKRGFAWRTLVPGWEQWHGGSHVRGAAFFGAATLTLIGFRGQEGRRQNASRTYEGALLWSGLANVMGEQTTWLSLVAYNTGRAAAQEARVATRNADALALTFAGLYAWNFFDATAWKVQAVVPFDRTSRFGVALTWTF